MFALQQDKHRSLDRKSKTLDREMKSKKPLLLNNSQISGDQVKT